MNVYGGWQGQRNEIEWIEEYKVKEQEQEQDNRISQRLKAKQKKESK